MYPLLMLRAEVVCLIILSFLFLFGKYYGVGKGNRSFQMLGVYSLGHVIFDIITILTVNNTDTVPNWLNLLLHEIFYLFAILFAWEFFCYIAVLCYSKAIQKRLRWGGFIPILLYAVLLPILGIEYIPGNGSYFCYGAATFVWYALSLFFFLASSIILILHFRTMQPQVRIALVPMLASLITAECIQIAVPEFLFSGCAITIITVGFFFSLENPAVIFRQKLMTDALTGVRSRHSYIADLKQLEKEYGKNRSLRFGLVFCDINNLKLVNDSRGHLEGDRYIGSITKALTENLKNAEGIYRLGGDEFFAVYRNKPESLIDEEIEAVHTACRKMSENAAYKMGVAIGYTISEEKYQTLNDAIKVADYLMYQNKEEMKKDVAFLSSDAQKLNLSGLTDRIFEAFSTTDERSYLSLCNLSTNVSRWSQSAVEYFGLPGEFIFDSLSVWSKLIHPDDVADYLDDISEVFTGKKKYHNIEYRARNKSGQYVTCSCRGTILKGKNGEPDMFAATITNHGIAETIDPITGLRTEPLFVQYVEDALKEHLNVAFLKIKIRTFSRINLLYGYKSGNEVLHRFSGILQRIAGKDGKVFRMNGTRFVLCLPNCTAKEAEDIYRQIQNASYKEIKLDSTTLPLKLAGGAFAIDKNFTGDSTVIRNSLTQALNGSKSENHGKLTFYENADSESIEGHRLLSMIHRDAVTDRKGFFLKYQPVLEMNTGKIIGAEALLRWKNAALGEVLPGKFIPWLENDPCFFQLGKWILKKALSDAAEILKNDPDFVISVNITALQLEDERFNNMIMDVLRQSNFPPNRLCLELTERCRELDSDFLVSQIKFLHENGIRIALDDVGTGFSSLEVLFKLPVDQIKLDKTFVNDICNQKANQAFVSAIVDAAKRLGCQSCIEGIEDEATYQHVRTYNANAYQGFYFSKPIPFAEFQTLLEKIGEPKGSALQPA